MGDFQDMDDEYFDKFTDDCKRRYEEKKDPIWPWFVVSRCERTPLFWAGENGQPPKPRPIPEFFLREYFIPCGKRIVTIAGGRGFDEEPPEFDEKENIPEMKEKIHKFYNTKKLNPKDALQLLPSALGFTNTPSRPFREFADYQRDMNVLWHYHALRARGYSGAELEKALCRRYAESWRTIQRRLQRAQKLTGKSE